MTSTGEPIMNGYAQVPLLALPLCNSLPLPCTERSVSVLCSTSLNLYLDLATPSPPWYAPHPHRGPQSSTEYLFKAASADEALLRASRAAAPVTSPHAVGQRRVWQRADDHGLHPRIPCLPSASRMTCILQERKEKFAAIPLGALAG
jgi:hypothetical protein